METAVHVTQLTNFIDDAVRHVFPSPVDNSIIFFADLPYS